MKEKSLFDLVVGEKLKSLVIKYNPYNEAFDIYPYHHIGIKSFEERFSDLMFKSIVFYAFEKSEIIKEYENGHFENLEKLSRSAYEARVPKTEKEADGLLGELALDSFVKCFFSNIEMTYSRVKYLERFPKKEISNKRKGKEVKGYDGLVFSLENGKKYMWVGQVKTGEWDYCLNGIKEDINKSIIDHYFSDSMIIMADIMRGDNSHSPELSSIIDTFNDFYFNYSDDTAMLHEKVINYIKDENITIRIPCLIISNETEYDCQNKLLDTIKGKVRNAFKGFTVKNQSNLPIEILLLVFPVKDLKQLRENFLSKRIEI